MKESKKFAATIAAIEVVTSKNGKQNLSFTLSNMKLDDAEVDVLPSYNDAGEEAPTNRIGKGLRCCVGLASVSPFGKVIAAKTGGKPEQYEGVTEVLIYLLTGAEIKGDREEYEKDEVNPDLPDTKYNRPTMRTVIKHVKLNVDPALNPFIMEALKSITLKAVNAAIADPFAVQ